MRRLRLAPLGLVCLLLPAVAQAQTPAPTSVRAAPAPVLAAPPPPPAPDAATPTDAERIARLEAQVAALLARTGEETAPVAPPREVTGSGPPPTAPLQPTLLAETDYRLYSSSVEGESGFAFARLRPGLQLAPPGKNGAAPWFRGVFALEFAQEKPDILDAYFRVKASEAAEVTVGYSKPPFFATATYEQVHLAPFPDIAPVVSAFGLGRDLGADVHLTPRSLPLEGWLRIGNGTGSPLGNDNALPAGYAQLDLVLGRAKHGAHEAAWGLRLGGSALLEKAADRDGVKGVTPLGFVYYRPAVVSGERLAVEGHAVVYAGPIRVVTEAAFADEGRSKDNDGNPATPRVSLPSVRSYGATAELSWVLRGERREVGTGPRGRGAIELAARYDGLWLGRGTDVPRGGSQGAAIVARWYPTPFLGTSLAAYATHYDTPAIERPDARWSTGLLARASFYWGLGKEQPGVLLGGR